MSVEWVAVDWGTSNLRIWGMSAAGQVLGEKRSDQGMGQLEPSDFEAALVAHIEQWLTDRRMPVMACGMVGSRQGWQEAPYSTTPTAPIQNYISVRSADPRIDVRILAGVKQARPADVMRGEETQIAGFLSANPRFEGTICLPGTHSKWVDISDGRIQKFQTVLTGELFALLSQKSVLRHSPGKWDDDAFVQTMKTSFHSPQNALASLFSIRARALLDGDNVGISRISGTVIGSELAGATEYWRDKDITVIGTGSLARLYTLALQTLAQNVQEYRASGLTLSGLTSAYRAVFR